MIVPAVSFVASANVVLASGLVPRFVDVDPAHVRSRSRSASRPRSDRALAPSCRSTSSASPATWSPILAIAASPRSPASIEDSCETMFVGYRGRPVGSFGDLACFSTRVSHLVSTGIGGFACTERPGARRDRAEPRERRPRRASAAANRNRTPDHFVFERVGFSYRASELEAALGVRSSRSATS